MTPYPNGITPEYRLITERIEGKLQASHQPAVAITFEVLAALVVVAIGIAIFGKNA